MTAGSFGPNGLIGFGDLETIERVEPAATVSRGRAWRGTDISGRLWWCKDTAFHGDHMLAAEVVGHMLGRALGVPMPKGGVGRCLVSHLTQGLTSQPPPGEMCPAWCSLDLSIAPHHALHWCDVYPDNPMRPTPRNERAWGAVMALDAVIGNPDRHGENALVDALGDVYFIDAGASMAGDFCNFTTAPADYAWPMTTGPARPLCVEGRILNAGREAALIACELAQEGSERYIRTVAEAACAHLDHNEPAMIRLYAETLRRRLLHSMDLFDDYVAAWNQNQ